jgi:transcriptional regulator with XRE-family HTH domain
MWPRAIPGAVVYDPSSRKLLLFQARIQLLSRCREFSGTAVRRAAGFRTAEALARKMGFARETIAKVESGERTPSDDVYAAWLQACRCSAELRANLDDQLELARNYELTIPRFAEPWLAVEAAADFIRVWALDVMPGLLQTYEYAFAMFVTVGLDEDTAAKKAAARVKRQSILEGPDATRVTFIIWEPILNRLVGTPEVTAKELTHLLEMMDRPNVVIQVVRDTGYFAGLEAQFEIATGREIPDTLVMVTLEDQTSDDPALVDTATALFERIRGYAESMEESRAIIQEALKRWQSQQH